MSVQNPTAKSEQPKPKLRPAESITHPYSGRICKVIDSFVPRSGKDDPAPLLTEEMALAIEPYSDLSCPLCNESKIKEIKLVESDPPSKYPLLVVICEKAEIPHWLVASGESNGSGGSDV